LIRELLFADDAALVAHSEDELQLLMNKFSYACKQFGLTISIKKTKVMGQDVESPPHIMVDGSPLEAVDNFTYLGSTTTNQLSLDVELSSRIGKAAAMLSSLSKRVWDNNKLTLKTKICVYRACVVNTLLYSSETWNTYMHQEHRLNSFHLRCLRRILHVSWRDRIPNSEVLLQAGVPSMYSLLAERRLRWLGHVRRMESGRIPKDLLYGELATGSRPRGRPFLRYSDTCRRDMKMCGIDSNDWERTAENRSDWRRTVKTGTKLCEERVHQRWTEKRALRHRAAQQQQASLFVCDNCGRDCHSRIGLYSHNRRCIAN
jgi:hypothetical protein